jgi:hypothetical protein
MNEAIAGGLDPDHARGELERISHSCAKRGLDFKRDRRGRPLSLAGIERPHYVSLLEEQLGEGGGKAYRQLSAISHGSYHGVLPRMMLPFQEAGDGGSGDESAPRQGTVYLRADEVITLGYLAFASFCQASRRMADLLGAAETPWDALLKEGRRLATRTYEEISRAVRLEGSD